MRYVFADCLLDTQLYTLSRAGLAIPLRPKAFHVLRYLLEHRDHLVSKEELCTHVWPAQFISDATIEGCVKRARQAIGDTGRAQQLIQTRRGYGYRFVGAVEERPEAPPTQTPTGTLRLGPAATPQDDTPRLPASTQLPGEDSIASGAGAMSPAPGSSLAPWTASATPVQGVPSAERKLVTLLGCSLAQAAALQACVGLDALHSQMRTLYTLAQEEIQRYGGTMHHVAGTRLLALFGAPVAQEDHARRALLAAWGLHQRLAASRRGDPAAEPLTACLGLHTGLMALGGIGDAQGATAVVGDLPLTVEALHEHAAPGMLLCTQPPARLLQRDVRLEEVAPVPVPGQPRPVRTYQVLGLHAQDVARSQGERRARSPFVGRAHELATLHAVLAQVVGGRGQAVGIVGEPGMGKSRLLAEWRQQLQAHGVAYLEGRCLSYGSATPYLPVLDWLRAHCGITSADGEDTITAKVCGRLQAVGLEPDIEAPYLLHLLGVEAATVQVAGSSPEVLKAHTLATLRQLWLKSSQQHPLILAVEDLHWSDPTSEELVASLVESLPGAAILVLGTYRPGYRPVWLEKSYATQLTVPPLAAQDSVQVVQAVLQYETVPPSLAEALLAKAQGNPFFLEELAQTLVEQDVGQGAPIGQSPRLQSSVPDLQLPPTVQAVLASRIDCLAPEAKRLLQTAAVIGVDVPVPLLQAIAELPEAALHQGLAHLQAAEFLYETHRFPQPAYTFKHALTHDVVYGSLLLERRWGLHGRIVEALEALAPDRLAEQVDRLAHHAVRGEVWDKAVTYCRQAGTKAVTGSAYREAVGYWEQALEALAHLSTDRPTLEQAIDLHINLSFARRLFGQYEQELTSLREAETLAETLGDQRRLGHVYDSIGVTLRQLQEYEPALAYLQRAHVVATALEDADLQMRVHEHLGQTYYNLGNYRQAMAYLQQNLMALQGEQLSQSSGRMLVRPSIQARVYMVHCLSELGEFADGVAYGDEARQIAEVGDRPYERLAVAVRVGYLHGQRGTLYQAIPQLEQAVALSQEANMPNFSRLAAAYLALAYALAGRTTDALPLFGQAGGTTETFFLYLYWGEVYLYAGEVEEAYRLAQHELTHARKRKARGYEARALWLLGEIAMHNDPPDAVSAAVHYQQTLTLAEELSMRPLQAHCHHGLGTLCAKSGQQEQARAALSTAIAMYHSMDMTFWLPQAEAALAQVSVC